MTKRLVSVKARGAIMATKNHMITCVCGREWVGSTQQQEITDSSVWYCNPKIPDKNGTFGCGRYADQAWEEEIQKLESQEIKVVDDEEFERTMRLERQNSSSKIF